ncbi:MAG: hypothetical protein MK212_19980 [Saprospiraceae bacterium]|nr:hypothetical protein [Saprospiraceae bacterium]
MQTEKYNFYLNPHEMYKWTKCPKCDAKTKLRKFCLLINYGGLKLKNSQLFILNKSCKYCPSCDLIIAHQCEIESNMQEMVNRLGRTYSPNNCDVLGTIDRAVWRKGKKGKMSPKDALAQASLFKDIWDFEIRPAGWYFDSDD